MDMFVLVQSLYYRIHGPSLNYSLAIQTHEACKFIFGNSSSCGKTSEMIREYTGKL
jgi:hypothetical protein